MPSVALTKHHGLGNDFLVAFTDQAVPRIAWAAIARRVCDRRRGIGADGLVVGVPPDETDGALGMLLYNADGSAAEMSGNGIRCLVQAWARREGRVDGDVVVATVAGDRKVRFGPDSDTRTINASVDMGPVAIIGPPEGWEAIGVDSGRPVAHLTLGNPHTVVAVDDVDGGLDLLAIGRAVPEVNLEIIHAGPEEAAVTMRVHERGVGITEACGTGACAAAWAASHWGLVPRGPSEITVHMEGGDANVVLDEPAAGRVTLVGPAIYIGTAVMEL